MGRDSIASWNDVHRGLVCDRIGATGLWHADRTPRVVAGPPDGLAGAAEALQAGFRYPFGR
jgi:hypothetical protein